MLRTMEISDAPTPCGGARASSGPSELAHSPCHIQQDRPLEKPNSTVGKRVAMLTLRHTHSCWPTSMPLSPRSQVKLGMLCRLAPGVSCEDWTDRDRDHQQLIIVFCRSIIRNAGVEFTSPALQLSMLRKEACPQTREFIRFLLGLGLGFESILCFRQHMALSLQFAWRNRPEVRTAWRKLLILSAQCGLAEAVQVLLSLVRGEGELLDRGVEHSGAALLTDKFLTELQLAASAEGHDDVARLLAPAVGEDEAASGEGEDAST
mmetsp:Transcript_36456/g.117880  ORF Transcript_36456/g.117880 Transcript_36456/m.117880 type:complete len:263 (+) Transcript_36456:1124-1912(+)